MQIRSSVTSDTDPTRTPLRSSALPRARRRQWGVGFSQRPSDVAVVTVSLKFSSMARWRRRRPVRSPSNPPSPRPPFIATPPAPARYPALSQPSTRLDTRDSTTGTLTPRETAWRPNRRAAFLVGGGTRPSAFYSYLTIYKCAQMCVTYILLGAGWRAANDPPTALWGRQGVRPPAPPHMVLQPRLHPENPPRPHPRTRRACAPLPVAFAPRGADPRACLPAATPPHPSRHPVCRRSRGGVRPRQGSREARRGAQWRRRGPRGLGERSGARGEAQGLRRRDFSRHTGARGTHAPRPRAPH